MEFMFADIDDDVQSEVVHIVQAFPKLVNICKGKSGGDPFVVAQALAANPHLVVVTQEAGGSADKPRIPYVCNQLGASHRLIDADRRRRLDVLERFSMIPGHNRTS
ncbi:hypothetical protein WSK_4125 [Novosphingobium sp. Rr 2-17]|nr:hypothetical protein WSK_4125 [Novosphingobium sp. Rr 2-17]